MNAGIFISELTCEYLKNPIGIDAIQPSFGWKICSNKRGIVQLGYQIKVSSNAKQLYSETNLSWNSGRVNSKNSQHVKYSGLPLESRK